MSAQSTGVVRKSDDVAKGETWLEDSVADAASQPVAVEAETILNVLNQLAEPLAQIFRGRSEVVVHDLSRLPHSIITVAGDLTGRRPGDPATDFLLERAANDQLETEVGYATALQDGTELNSSTVVIQDQTGVPVAALCINEDLQPWRTLQELIRQSAPALPDTGGEPSSGSARESFARDVEGLADSILSRAVREQGVPVELMQKEHKVAVVRAAKGRGLFMLRDAVEMVADRLGVTRFTIYNYLSEITEQGDVVSDEQ